jgi:two-component system sensor histidine kinase DesK
MLPFPAVAPQTDAAEVWPMSVVEDGATVAPATRVPVPRDDGTRPGPFRVGWLFAAIWLVYLWQPLQRAWHHPDVGVRVPAVVALVVFAVAWAGFFGWWRMRRLAGEPLRPAVTWTALAVGAGLLAVAAPAVHEQVIAGFVYLGVTATMTLPARQALAAVAVLVGLVLLLPRVLTGWANVDDFVPELLLACFAAFGVSQVLQRNIQLARAREELVDLAVTRERERLARDVHDILGHSLTVITVKTELAGRLLEAVGPDPRLDRVRAEVADVEGLARAALADVRATAAGTREMSLAGELAEARQALEAAGIGADLPVSVEEVPAGARELFAWTVREGVTNVVRHSGAHWCGIRLGGDAIEVRDDGRRAPAAGGGTGLAGLQARAEAAGARLETGTAPEGGFLLRVTTA